MSFLLTRRYGKNVGHVEQNLLLLLFSYYNTALSTIYII